MFCVAQGGDCLIYLDNAATTWPKPEETVTAVVDCLKHTGANPGRGGHRMSLAAGRIIFETREAIARLFNVNDPERIILTGNATESLNLALKGYLKPGDHVITTSMEHNAVARPLHVLKSQGVEITEVRCSGKGMLDPGDMRNTIKKNTKAIVMLHASNVTGTIMPAREVGKMARENGLCFILDAAQTAGFLDIDVEEIDVDLLAFTGHKGLYGPQGTGGLFVRKGVELEPLKQGGTGSQSESAEQPEDLPDKFESGTPNTPGVAGLGAGIRFIRARGLEEIRRHERALTSRFLEGLKQLKRVEIYGPADPELQVPVVSINIKDQDSSEVAFVLDRVFEISCRSGLHCSPRAHKTIGTIERGALRFSFSVFTTEAEIDKTLQALDEIIGELP